MHDERVNVWNAAEDYLCEICELWPIVRRYLCCCQIFRFPENLANIVIYLLFFIYLVIIYESHEEKIFLKFRV